MRVLILFGLVACSDYDLNTKSDRSGVDDTSEPDGPDTDSDTDIPDGDDDDDGACDAPDLSPQAVEVDEACEGTTVGTFTPIIEWTNSAVGDGYTTPIIGQLTDDNGNGAIDSGDIPDVVYANAVGDVYVMAGDTGTVLWSAGNLGAEPMTPAIGDLDGDGWPEVVGAGTSGTIAWRGNTGVVYWRAAAYAGNVSGACGAVGIWDLNGNGTPEVVIGRSIYNATDGSLRASGNAGDGSGHGWAAPISAAADIDQDGVMEIVVGNALYDPRGDTIWNNGQSDGYVAIADFDGDPYGEIVVGTTGSLRLQDDDGTVLWNRAGLTGATIGTPTVADFDGDGLLEIGVAGNGRYIVVEDDGNVKWSRPTEDYSSGFTGSSVFDFEGDGAAEVIYADENDLYVLDGATGAIKLQESRHSSATCSEYPSVADVDNDGHAEIIYSSSRYSGSESGITVVGDADDSWQRGRTVWNQHAYNITNVEESGEIPAVPDTNWLSYNNYRSADLASSTGGTSSDAVVLLSEICNVECDEGLLRVTVVLGNAGTIDLPAGVKVSAYAYHDGTPEWVETQTVVDAVASGSSSPGIVFEFDPANVERKLLFIADDDNGSEAVAECDEDNNTLEVNDSLCP